MEQSWLAREIGMAAAKLSPPAFLYMGNFIWGPQEWSAVCIGGYAVLQAAHLVWKWRKEAKKP